MENNKDEIKSNPGEGNPYDTGNKEVDSLIGEIGARKKEGERQTREREKKWQIFTFTLLFIVMIGAGIFIYLWTVNLPDEIPLSDREIIGSFGPVGPGVDGGSYYFKFDNKVYFKDARSKIRKIPEADARTFRSINKLYQMDDYHVYTSGYVIEGADPETFTPLEWPYARDKDGIYFNYVKKLEDADPETFEVLLSGYNKDKNSVWYHDTVIKGADPVTFEVLNDNYAKDKNNYYRFDKVSGQVTD